VVDIFFVDAANADGILGIAIYAAN
jgi:hypothetical protein